MYWQCFVLKEILDFYKKNPLQGISAALYLQLPDICIKVGHGPAVVAAGAGCLLSGSVESHRCYQFLFTLRLPFGDDLI